MRVLSPFELEFRALVFAEGGKPENLEKKPRGATREPPTNSIHITNKLIAILFLRACVSFGHLDILERVALGMMSDALLLKLLSENLILAGINFYHLFLRFLVSSSFD